ncbi:uncharacterized protein LOC126260048 isoform X2 [Schistocerca nitens]|uniref:uncharacterized protein LOC126260048 isoform X2 n=1 Tax=Schistocerca nitens TaxID=7011 RepID=UPI002118C542|nr:uncharacterized protein LOC126260048 isoform X2 [Schistocerca nitens]
MANLLPLPLLLPALLLLMASRSRLVLAISSVKPIAETEVLRQGSMGWSNVYSYANEDICHAIQSFSPEFWKSLMKAAGIPDECPVQPGNYTVNEWKPLLDLDKMPSLPYGTYRLIIQLKQGTGQLVGCYQILVEVSENVDA